MITLGWHRRCAWRKRGRYSAHPNPRVGCVLVKAGILVGEGWHQVAGGPHAEVNAIAAAGDKAAASTAYVTLEPCAHFGKTAPCADALIGAGVTRVIIAHEDPNPKVSGQGVSRLMHAGIDVQLGLMRDEARTLNRGFLSRHEAKRPFVTVKLACSLDGATAMLGGESQWITGPEARQDVQALRASSGAILTGIETVLADDPALNVRADNLATAGVQPLRVVLDSALRTPPSARMLTLPGETIVYCVADENRAPLEDHGASVVQVEAANGQPQLGAIMRDLADRGVNDVLVEAGPTVCGSFLTSNLVDELVIYQAPHIMGSETRRLVSTPGWVRLDQRLSLEILDTRRIGADLRVTARPVA